MESRLSQFQAGRRPVKASCSTHTSTFSKCRTPPSNPVHRISLRHLPATPTRNVFDVSSSILRANSYTKSTSIFNRNLVPFHDHKNSHHR
ncbi:hypothetical protein L2E82_46547 [Cichorium intybus]|uniref:Uncharacterized protein n=1 Tax=Cichorium intybus TaxID=13427 RepID=A0ACB8YXK6_CICIN|nr:hypothetical protein L1887_26258 [Cichorium endivia]KAI3688750.1 hypothetical protein L2E82_46547 [Cichorium intybus]